jgi:hypothetical protein
MRLPAAARSAARVPRLGRAMHARTALQVPPAHATRLRAAQQHALPFPLTQECAPVTRQHTATTPPGSGEKCVHV